MLFDVGVVYYVWVKCVFGEFVDVDVLVVDCGDVLFGLLCVLVLVVYGLCCFVLYVVVFVVCYLKFDFDL